MNEAQPANLPAAVRHATHLALMGETQFQAWGRDRTIDLVVVTDLFLDAIEDPS